MSGFSFVLFIPTILIYGVLITNLNTQIGQPCASTDNFAITTFDITPYPPTLGKTSNITIIGKTLHTIDFGQIIYAIENQYQQWFYQYQTINQTYSKNLVLNFNYTLTWPNSSGNYLSQVTIHEQAKQYIIDACWTFAFSL
ncbi:hypothetical protein SteCoe_31594 [Stentor coeruleus]|uniref:Uncharacterized protein n=1 Tax=Stentor coeruleus TaxID=5963 RepID=A0A1R2B0W4_9CILI|nr:hypothetical protein SteCoe_31594 [Stentor coeruleus]